MAQLPLLLQAGGLLVFSWLSHPARPCPAPCQCFGNTTVFCSEDCIAQFDQGVTSSVFVETSLGPVLSGEAFANYSHSLHKLVFLCCPIGSLGRGAFEGLPQLRELEISNSQLSNLTDDAFLGLDQLRKLSLKYSLVETLEGGGRLFQNTPSLRALQLQGNRIHSLPLDTFQPVGQLESLSLSGNCLAELPGKVFEPLALLRVLELSDNQLSFLPPDLFLPLRGLQELHLEGNSLAVLSPGLFAPLSRLRRLHLQHNTLVHLPPALFSSLSRLVFLHLDHNWLRELPTSLFQGTSELTELSLAHNQLESLPERGLFGHLPNLSVLVLSHNRLGHLPAGTFAGLPALARLQLSHNNLSALPREVFVNLTHLEQLDLAHNRLATLPEAIFDSNDALFSVALKGNPWACDCHLGYLADWLQNTEGLFNAQALCRSPAHLQGLSLAGVQKEQLVCPQLPPESAPCPKEGQDPSGELSIPTSSSSSQCLYQDPGGALRLVCDLGVCHRLLLQLPPGQGLPGEGQQHLRKVWTLGSDCGSLRIQVSITVEKEKPLEGGGEAEEEEEEATASPAKGLFSP